MSIHPRNKNSTGRTGEKVRALLGHKRIDTTQIYASIRPSELKRSVGFYDEKARRMLDSEA